MNFFKQKQTTSIDHQDMENIIRMHYRFTGTVQGVGFRVEVWKRAMDLGLSGWVKNNLDGSVECELQGKKEKMDRLIASMRAIPRIHINDISSSMIPVKKEHGFEMRGY